jgi:hypothetical protein
MDRKSFLLRLDPATMDALRGWANDDLRSLNGQIEFVLRRALRDSGRLPGGRVTGAARTSTPRQADAASAAGEQTA